MKKYTNSMNRCPEREREREREIIGMLWEYFPWLGISIGFSQKHLVSNAKTSQTFLVDDPRVGTVFNMMS